MLSKDLGFPSLHCPRPLPLRKYARAGKKKETRITRTEEGGERGECLKTGSEHKGNRTLAYAWPFCSTAVTVYPKHENPPRPLERVASLSLPLHTGAPGSPLNLL